MSEHLHVDVHDGDGPYLLLVHGMLASRASWLPNLAALRRVCRPVVVELWGHGRSPTPAETERFHPDAYVEELDRLRAAIGCERWFVCGASLGAALTIRYSLDRPDRVIGQIFTNSSSALADAAWRARVAPYVERDAERVLAEGRDAIRAHPLFPGRSTRLPEAARAALAADAELHDPAGIAATLRHTVPASPVRDRVQENVVPALLVVGERETPFAESRAHVAARMPHLEVVATPAGHAVNLETPAAFDDAVCRFVAGTPR